MHIDWLKDELEHSIRLHYFSIECIVMLFNCFCHQKIALYNFMMSIKTIAVG